jgi:hypothetical protein
LLGESTCMWVTTMLIKIMFGPYILIFHQINFYTLFLSVWTFRRIYKWSIVSLLIQHGCYQSGL